MVTNRVKLKVRDEFPWIIQCYLDGEYIGNVGTYYNDDRLTIGFTNDHPSFYANDLREMADEIERQESQLLAEIKELHGREETV